MYLSSHTCHAVQSYWQHTDCACRSCISCDIIKHGGSCSSSINKQHHWSQSTINDIISCRSANSTCITFSCWIIICTSTVLNWGKQDCVIIDHVCVCLLSINNLADHIYQCVITGWVRSDNLFCSVQKVGWNKFDIDDIEKLNIDRTPWTRMYCCFQVFHHFLNLGGFI